jgi:hypothetical protein
MPLGKNSKQDIKELIECEITNTITATTNRVSTCTSACLIIVIIRTNLATHTWITHINDIIDAIATTVPATA